MQPNTPAPTPADYDFILNHGANAPKRSLLPGFGGSGRQRYIKIGLAGAVLLIIIVLLSSLLFGGSKNESLVGIAQTQQELIRVSTIGAQKAQTSAASQLAVNTELTVMTNQKDVLAQLKKSGQKVNTKVLALKQNSQTDAALTEAALNNRYDEAFIQVMQKQLVDYQKLLKATYDTTSSRVLQQILNNEFNQATVLLASTKST